MIQLCECGCGESAPVARFTNTHQGVRVGDTQRFVRGHNRRISAVEYIVEPETDCWLWQRALFQDGSGMAMDPETKRVTTARRVMWLRHNGPIPDGVELSRLCEAVACVNPAHHALATGKRP
jgi:hypothetical protein